jgi:MFS family permease
MSERGRRTLPWDLTRGVFEGAAQALIGTFALLVAIKYFDCSDNLKAMIVAGSSWGMTFSFLYATYSHHFIRRRNLEAGIPVLISSICLMLCAWASDPFSYAVLAFFGGLFFMSNYPLMTAIFRENYKRAVRGQVVALGLLAIAGSNMIVTSLGGKHLEADIENFRPLFFVLGFFVLCSGLAILRIPSRRALETERPNPFGYFAILKKDKVFVYILFVWFLFGLANLSLLPQRFEYVSQERYGFSLSPLWIAVIVGVIPEILRIVLVIPMGWLFDRVNFILFRMIVNVFFFIYMIVYFHATNVLMLVVGMVFLGFSFAGGSISWTLWVTKYASPAETAKYMAMHTFFNGVRGIVGPYLGYWIAAGHSIPTTANIGAGLMIVSNLLLLPLLKQGAPNDFKKGEGTEPAV